MEITKDLLLSIMQSASVEDATDEDKLAEPHALTANSTCLVCGASQ